MKYVCAITLLVVSSSCGPVNINLSATIPDITITTNTPTDPTAPAADPGIASNDPVAPVTPPVDNSTPITPTTVSLTYYSLTKTLASTSGSGGVPAGSVDGIGSCVIYLSQTYCWDNGIKTLTGTSVKTSFWDIDQGMNACGTSCLTDLMTSPIRITANLSVPMNYANTFLFSATRKRTPTLVLTTGSPTSVSCTETSGILNCVNFTIDLNQADL